MKTVIFIIVIIITVLLSACSNDSEIIEEPIQLIHLETLAGGCNNQKFDHLKDATFESDSTHFTLRGDTLNLFVGLNYICCAPFVSEVNVSNDSIMVKLIDTCDFPNQNCYCKCNCYYTWDFNFSVTHGKDIFLLVELIDPRQEKPKLIFKGKKEY